MINHMHLVICREKGRVRLKVSLDFWTIAFTACAGNRRSKWWARMSGRAENGVTLPLTFPSSSRTHPIAAKAAFWEGKLLYLSTKEMTAALLVEYLENINQVTRRHSWTPTLSSPCRWKASRTKTRIKMA